MNRFPYIVGLLLLSFGSIILAQEEPKEKPKETEMPDPQKLAVEAQKAADLLKKKDTGTETQKIQQDVAKAIDDLIKQRKDPPPPPMMPPPMMPPDMMPPPMMNMMPPPMGMMGMPPPMGMMGMPPPMMNMGGMSGGGMGMTGMKQPDKGGMSRKEKREQEKEKEKGMTAGKDPMKKEMGMGMDKKDMKDMTGMGMKDKKGMEGMMMDMGMMAMGNPEKGPPPKENPPRKPEKLTEMYKDLWGSLPDRARQELDVYDRERYMPRYADLLSRYFSNISEAKKKGNDK